VDLSGLNLRVLVPYLPALGWGALRAGVNHKVSSKQWHDLRLRAVGDRFTVFFDGKQLFEATDRRLSGAGGVALVQADSVTEFTDLTIEPMP
jgi:hypothetical protein